MDCSRAAAVLGAYTPRRAARCLIPCPRRGGSSVKTDRNSHDRRAQSATLYSSGDGRSGQSGETFSGFPGRSVVTRD